LGALRRHIRERRHVESKKKVKKEYKRAKEAVDDCDDDDDDYYYDRCVYNETVALIRLTALRIIFGNY